MPAIPRTASTATGKFFSNGLALEWLGQNPDRIEEYAVAVHELLRDREADRLGA